MWIDAIAGHGYHDSGTDTKTIWSLEREDKSINNVDRNMKRVAMRTLHFCRAVSAALWSPCFSSPSTGEQHTARVPPRRSQCGQRFSHTNIIFISVCEHDAWVWARTECTLRKHRSCSSSSIPLKSHYQNHFRLRFHVMSGHRKERTSHRIKNSTFSFSI